MKKRFFSLIFVLVSLVTLSFVFSACTEEYVDPIVGKWYDEADNLIYRFDKDGTFGGSDLTTWEYDTEEKVYIITWLHPNIHERPAKNQSARYAMSEDKKVLTNVDNGKTLYKK